MLWTVDGKVGGNSGVWEAEKCFLIFPGVLLKTCIFPGSFLGYYNAEDLGQVW